MFFNFVRYNNLISKLNPMRYSLHNLLADPKEGEGEGVGGAIEAIALTPPKRA